MHNPIGWLAAGLPQLKHVVVGVKAPCSASPTSLRQLMFAGELCGCASARASSG